MKHPIKTKIYYKATWLWDRLPIWLGWTVQWIRDITFNSDLYE